MVAIIHDIFSVIFSGNDRPIPSGSSEVGAMDIEIEAIEALCERVAYGDRSHRISDKETMRGISEITRNIELLADPHNAIACPRFYAVNCRNCHLIGHYQLTQLSGVKFPVSLSWTVERPCCLVVERKSGTPILQVPELALDLSPLVYY